MKPGILPLAVCATVIGTALAARPAQRAAASIGDIQNIIVIYQDGRSFDSLYGTFPEANGIGNAKGLHRQVDRSGKPYATLPANHSIDLLDSRFFQEQLQIDKGKMDKFVAWSEAGGLAMETIDASDLPEGKLARDFTLADTFYHAAFGGAFLNLIWSICACPPVWPGAPADIVAQVAKDGTLIKDGIVTPDGFAVNGVAPLNMPFPASVADSAHRLPLQKAPTIGDRLTARNISWRWYSGGYDDAMAGKADRLFRFDRQPFVYFEDYADGTPARQEFLKDEAAFYEDLKGGKLPSVAFIKPLGQEQAVKIVDLIRQSPYWMKSAIFIVYEDNGGRWDHVAPGAIDRWGPGTRVPAIIVSPFAKKHYVDHTPYETTSIMAFIERRWNLRPLAVRDSRANDLTGAFEFAR